MRSPARLSLTTSVEVHFGASANFARVSDAVRAQSLTPADHKTIARIESFSDIVFGFSLFNLALNFRAPNSPQELLAQIPLFIVFVAPFAILCQLWWLHHRLFRDYFVPDTAGVILNFALLASVAMFSYPLQLYFRFGFSNPITFVGYAAGALLVYGLMGSLFLIGVKKRGEALSHEQRITGRSIGLRLSIFAVGTVVAMALYSQGPIAMIIALAIAGIVARLLGGAAGKAAEVF